MCSMKEKFIELKDVSVLRGQRKILDNISLDISLDENIALIGPNGSGKSTLIKLIIGKIYPSYTCDNTVCKLFGRSQWNISELRNKLGIVTNELQYDFHRDITGIEAVLSGFFSSIGIFNNHKITEEMKKRSYEIIDFLEVSHLQKEKLDTMSSGEAKRFLIARALVNNPKVLVLDEPSNSLDIAAAIKFNRTLRKIASLNTKIVLVTHQVSDIIPEIERFVFLKDGKIFADGNRESVFTSEKLSLLFDVKIVLKEKDGLYWFQREV